MAWEIGPIPDGRIEEWVRVMSRSFGGPPTGGGDQEAEAGVHERDRSLAVLDGDQMVGTAGIYSMDMTLPGGAAVPVAAVTGITVTATHTRRGILRELMQVQLEDAVERGESMLVLNASEAGIYQRFGYGLAQLYSVVELWRERVSFAQPPPDIPLRFVHQEDATPVLGPIWDAWRPTRAGSLSQSDAWWRCVLSTETSWKGGGDLHIVATGDDVPPEAGGFVIWKIVDGGNPRGATVQVRELVAADPAVEARLWQQALSVDLTHRVVGAARPVDDPLRWWLADPRQYRTSELRDYLFVRIVDVPAALSARQYALAGDLVLEVVDEVRPASGGRFALSVDEAGDATCEPTGADADLVLRQEDLGSLLLGGVRARDLAIAGRIAERTTGAVALADAVMTWPVAPMCLTWF